MPITTMDALVAALPGQHQHFFKTVVATTVGGIYHTLWDKAGRPGAGSLTVGDIAAGVIPTKATTGALSFVNAAGGLKNYLGRLFGANSINAVLVLYDRLYHAGSFVTTSLATVTLASQPALTRPSATGDDAEIWLEFNVAMGAGATSIEVTYTNSAGVAGRTTGAILTNIASATTGRMIPMPLQAGDSGVQKIETVIVGAVVNTGTFNVVILRKIAEVGITVANTGVTLDAFDVGMPEISTDACIALLVLPTTTNSGTPYLALDIITG